MARIFEQQFENANDIEFIIMHGFENKNNINAEIIAVVEAIKVPSPR